jgi:hypothetical protein
LHGPDRASGFAINAAIFFLPAIRWSLPAWGADAPTTFKKARRKAGLFVVDIADLDAT